MISKTDLKVRLDGHTEEICTLMDKVRRLERYHESLSCMGYTLQDETNTAFAKRLRALEDRAKNLEVASMARFHLREATFCHGKETFTEGELHTLLDYFARYMSNGESVKDFLGSMCPPCT